LQNKTYTIDITSRGRNPKSISHSHIDSARVSFRSLQTKTFDKNSSEDRAVSMFAYGTNQGEPGINLDADYAADMRIPERISWILRLPCIIAFQFKFCQKKTYQLRFSNRLQNKAYTIHITSRGRNPKSISHDSECQICFWLV
jgi:hypothetical protein